MNPVLGRLYYASFSLFFTTLLEVTWPIVLLLQQNKVTREWYYSHIFGLICRLTSHILVAPKQKLFDALNEYCEEISPSQSGNVIKVQEIGPGIGDNFKFYKSAIQLTTIDLNVFLKETTQKLAIQYPLVNVVATHLANAEIMTCFEDDSFDIVCGTLIMCCIRNNEAALNEIHRVLKPGGRYYYFEGNRMQPSRTKTMRALEALLANLWRCFEYGCEFLYNNFDEKLKSSKMVSAWNVIYPLPECPINHETHYGNALKI